MTAYIKNTALGEQVPFGEAYPDAPCVDRQTLAAWCETNGVDVRTHNGRAYVQASPREEGYRDLWHLSDHRVESVGSELVWFSPRPRPTPA